jgi:hypothetical protein
MCLIDNLEMKVAEEDIPVWKLMWIKGKRVVTPFMEKSITNEPAAKFEESYGWHSFLDKKTANEFRQIAMNGAPCALWCSEVKSVKQRYLKIRAYYIPKGTRYVTGVIASGFVGVGLRAARSEYLRVGEGVGCHR